MRKTLRTGKKALSIFMAALMVMTAWVFFAPEKAEAATAGQYYYKVTFQVTNTMDNVQMLSTLYGKTNNGTGSEVAIASKNYTSDKDFSGTMTFVEGWTANGVFPTRFHIGDNNGAKYYLDRDLEGYWHVYVGPNASNLTEVYLNGVKHSSEAENMSVGSGQGAKWYWQVKNNWFTGKVNRFNIDYNIDSSYYPYVNSVSAISGSTSITMPKTGAAAITSKYSATAYDQYGVTWYADPAFYIRSSEPTSFNEAKSGQSLTGLTMNTNGTLTITDKAQIDGEESHKDVWVSCAIGADKWAKKKLTLTDPLYTIIFKQDGLSYNLDQKQYYYGSMPTEPKNYVVPDPDSEAGNPGHYFFDGWNPAFGKVTTDTIYTVKFRRENHNWVRTDIKDSTCSQEGKEYQECSVCGVTRELTVVKKPHTWVKGTVHAATCTTDGWTDYSCSKCPATKEDDKVPALGHDIYEASRREATCQSAGVINYKCNRCTYTYSETIPVVPHSYTKEAITKNATCTEKGHACYRCEWCDKYDPDRGGKDGVDTPALGHLWGDWYVKTPETCETDGVDERICKRDAAHTETRVRPKLDHDYDATKILTEPATCTKDGYTYHPCKHANCESKEIVETLPKRNHNDGGTGVWVTTTTVTCEQDGLEQYKCGLCGEYVQNNTIPKLGHKFTKYEQSSPATCVDNAKETAKCDNGCGKTDTREIADTKLGHEFLEENYKYDNNAKCEEDGTKTAKCTRCDAKNTVTAVGTALEHKFTNYKKTKDETCLENAQETATCNNGCGKTKTREIQNSALGHSCEKFTHDEETETCCELGTKTGTCVRCGVTYTVKEDRPEYYAPHVYETDADGNIVYRFVENSETCTSDGKERAYCTNAATHADGKNWNCGHYLEQTAKGTRHPHTFPDPETEPEKYSPNNDGTCQRNGTMSAVCSECKAAKKTVEMPNSKQDHKIVNWISDENATCTKDGTKHGSCAFGCGYEEVDVPDKGSKLGHWFRDYEEEKAADCLNDRVRTAKCERKDCTETDTITDEGSALGHSWSAWSFVEKKGDDGKVIAHDCRNGGTLERHCTRDCCVETDEKGEPVYKTTETKTVDPTEHTWKTETITETGEDGKELPADCERGYKTHQVCSVCGIEKENSVVEVPGGVHNFAKDEDLSFEPTCTTDGMDVITCATCGKLYSKKIVQASGHVRTYLDEKTVKAATCAEKGYSGDIKCLVCNEVVKAGTETPLTANHVFTKYVAKDAATCTMNRTEEATCDVCKTEKNTREVPGTALGHSFKEYIESKAATCTGDAEKTAKCERCDAIETVRVPNSALGHDWGEWTTIEEATCAKPGKAERKCKREGCTLVVNKQLRKLSHTESAWIIDEEADCTKEGKRHTECTGGCGYIFREEVIPKKEHSFVEEITGVTCLDDGFSTFTCSVCGEVKQGGIVKALGHDWSGEWVVTKQPTCTKKGQETLTCTRCDKTQTRPVDALGHLVVIDPAVEATCTTPGLSEGSHCGRCNEILKAQETVVKPHRDADGDGKCDECGKEIKHSTDLNCDCICHKEFWLMRVIYAIVRVFWKLFKIGKSCSCGATHY